MNRETHIALIEIDIRSNAHQIAAELYEKGYRKERKSELILDTEFDSKTKVRYYCRECDYWHTVKIGNDEHLLRTLRYCSFCGARFARESEQ